MVCNEPLDCSLCGSSIRAFVALKQTARSLRRYCAGQLNGAPTKHQGCREDSSPWPGTVKGEAAHFGGKPQRNVIPSWAARSWHVPGFLLRGCGQGGNWRSIPTTQLPNGGGDIQNMDSSVWKTHAYFSVWSNSGKCGHFKRERCSWNLGREWVCFCN